MSHTLTKRLTPLYAAAFFQGFMLFYVVDKLLATTVGMTATAIALVVGATALVTILCEIPSGIMADRWSRKGTLIISQILLGVCAVIGIFATNGWHYLVYNLAWGIFFAMYSGVYEALVYDVLLEEQGHAKNFEKRYARIGQLDGAALLAGALIGGVVAELGGVHAPFVLTLPSIVLGFIAMAWFKEPLIHKAATETSKLTAHIHQTFAVVRHSDVLKSLFLVSAAMGGGLRLLWEFNQLWYINLGLPVALFGVFSATIFLSLIARGWLVPKIIINRFLLLIILLVVGIAFTSLLMVANPYIAAVGVTMVMFSILSAELVLKVLQQNRLPSQVRAGATSVFSTVAHLVSIPAYVLFGLFIDRFGITRATLLLTVMFATSLVFAFSARKRAALEPVAVVE